MPAHEYVFLQSDKQDIYETDFETFWNSVFPLLQNNSDFAKVVSNCYNGISQLFVRNFMKELSLEDFDVKKRENAYIFFCALKSFIEHFESTSCLELSCPKKDYILSNFPSFPLQANLFLDTFYREKEDSDLLTNYRDNLLKLVLHTLNQLSKKMIGIQSKKKECEEMEICRIYGELITSNLYQFSNKDRFNSISVTNYYDENRLIEIPLDNTLSPSDNAKKYFKKYHKLQNTLEIITSQKKELTKQLDYLESILFELESSTSLADLDEIYDEIVENDVLQSHSKEKLTLTEVKRLNTSRIKRKTLSHKKRDQKSSPNTIPLMFQLDGFDFYLGKNNKQNDFIATKLGKNEDLWFHTQEIHGSHGLLKCNGSFPSVTNSTILACAKLVASHSKAKFSSNVPVDYCFAKYVKKPSSSKPGMVIYSHQKTVFVNPSV